MNNKNNSESEDSCQSEKRDWVLLQIKTNSIPALPCWLHLYLLWGKSTDILGEYLGNGAKTPWVMENFLIVTQHVLKLCTSRSVHPERISGCFGNHLSWRCRAKSQLILLHWLVVPQVSRASCEQNLWLLPYFLLYILDKQFFHLYQPYSETRAFLSSYY